MLPTEMRWLKLLEDENAKLRKLLASPGPVFETNCVNAAAR